MLVYFPGVFDLKFCAQCATTSSIVNEVKGGEGRGEEIVMCRLRTKRLLEPALWSERLLIGSSGIFFFFSFSLSLFFSLQATRDWSICICTFCCFCCCWAERGGTGERRGKGRAVSQEQSREKESQRQQDDTSTLLKGKVKKMSDTRKRSKIWKNFIVIDNTKAVLILQKKKNPIEPAPQTAQEPENCPPISAMGR